MQMEARQSLHMSGARAAKASEALGLTSMMAWLGRVPRRAAGGRGMCRDVCSFRILELAEKEAAICFE